MDAKAEISMPHGLSQKPWRETVSPFAVSTDGKPATVTHLWVEQDLIYTSMCQVLGLITLVAAAKALAELLLL